MIGIGFLNIIRRKKMNKPIIASNHKSHTVRWYELMRAFNKHIIEQALNKMRRKKIVPEK